MGLYVDRGNQSFQHALNSKIYVDKADLLKYTNEVLETEQNRICVTRPRCFGKSMAVDMLAVYYDKSCDSQGGAPYRIAEEKDYEKYFNQYRVIHLDITIFTTQEKTVSITTAIHEQITENLEVFIRRL